MLLSLQLGCGQTLYLHSIKPNKIVEDVEEYRKIQKEANNASKVLFVMEEIE